ncbi:MAG: Gfo/Idh/MocA family oxidoreductase [Gemmatimonadota bacterium]|nr:Gfo/Idh/MocA family oxidoreductase [Gemmatimonadota bacterium]
MIQIGVIGTGYWGKNLVRVFDEMPEANLYACCDASESRLRQVQKSYPDIRLFTSTEAMVEDDEVEAVAIATPSPTHFEVAKSALEAGKHVYVEKPLTLRSDDAEALVSLARKNERQIMVGHLLLYHPAVTTIKGLIASGELGDIYYVYAQRLNLGIVRKDENAWWSLAPHDISMVLYMFDSVPNAVSARGEGYLRHDNQDVVFANLGYSDRRMGQIHVSWLDPHKMRKITVVGSRKMVVFDDMEPTEKIRIYDKGVDVTLGYESYGDAITLRKGDIHIPQIDMAEPLKRECEHFISCINNKRDPLTDGRSGYDVVRVLEAGQQSLDRGGIPVGVEDNL